MNKDAASLIASVFPRLLHLNFIKTLQNFDEVFTCLLIERNTVVYAEIELNSFHC